MTLSRAEAHSAPVWNALSGRHARWGRARGPEGGATGAYRLATGDNRARLKASFSFHSLLASVYTQLGLVMHSWRMVMKHSWGWGCTAGVGVAQLGLGMYSWG